ncbi:MAG: YkgJ family cysteine cluster protein [Ferruginibacter sp.]
MPLFTLQAFKKKLPLYRKYFRLFLNKSEKYPPRGIDTLTPAIEKEVWAEVNCLTCANCCKTMTPTFTPQDIKRISAHLGETKESFSKKWLKKDRNQDMVNKQQPCQFLNLTNNMCSIYEVRPVDCSGFPHLSKRKWVDYAYIHKQNIDYCPATFKMVEKMMAKLHN